jgi:internalin A
MIRVRTQDGQAAALLERTVKVVERVQVRLGMRPVEVTRPAAVVEAREVLPMSFGLERSSEPRWYVSYAWGDRTPEGREREEIVDRLCAEAKARGQTILRDKAVMKLGDSISAFMRKIGEGDRVFVILSDKYLKSPHCMFELCEIWRTSRQEGPKLLDRVRVYTLGDADIWKPLARAKYAAHWRKEHDDFEAYVRENGGPSILGERDFAAYRRMGEFCRHVGDILATLADIVQPRSFEELKQYGFD